MSSQRGPATFTGPAGGVKTDTAVAQHTIRTEAADGLNLLVSRGTAAVREADRSAIGVLAFELDAEARGPLAGVLVEAEFSERSAGLQRLDVRIAGPISQPYRDVAQAALSRSGGTAYTNVIARTKDSRELFDLTVSFPRARFAFFAENLLLAGEQSSQVRLALERTLAALAVRHNFRGGALHVSRRQLRKPISVAAQIACSEALFEQGLIAELYAATLPATRSARLISDGGGEIDLVLSRGLASQTAISAGDYVELQNFLREFFSFDVGDKTWLVTNTHGSSERDRLGVIPARPKTTWSVNWGTKRQV